MNIDEILDNIEELLDRSWSLPLSGGRCVVDADKVRDLVDDIRLNLPSEIKQARGIVADRSEIIDNAKREAEQIVRKAEDRARALVSEEEVVKAAEDAGIRDKVKIMVGGAPVTQDFCDSIGADYYTEDAASAAICAAQILSA